MQDRGIKLYTPGFCKALSQRGCDNWGRSPRGMSGSSLRQGLAGSLLRAPRATLEFISVAIKKVRVTMITVYRFEGRSLRAFGIKAVRLRRQFAYLVSLPGGVIGNTRVFGTRIPGSSPGRVGF